MKYLESQKMTASNDLVVLFHGLGACKEDWITPGGFTSGGDLTALLDEACIPWMAADFYGHGDWQAVESGFDPENISDEIWDSFISRSVEAVYEILQRKIAENPALSLQLVSYSAGCIVLASFLAKYPDLPVCASHLASPVPQESMDDEYSMHNNCDAFSGQKLFWHCGGDDDENEAGEIERVFNRIETEAKKLYWYDCGHSLPQEWTRIAYVDIVGARVDTSKK